MIQYLVESKLYPNLEIILDVLEHKILNDLEIILFRKRFYKICIQILMFILTVI